MSLIFPQAWNVLIGPGSFTSEMSRASFRYLRASAAGSVAGPQLWSPTNTIGSPSLNVFMRSMMSFMPSIRARGTRWSVCVLMKQNLRPVALSESIIHRHGRIFFAPQPRERGTSGVSESQNTPFLTRSKRLFR